MNRQSQIETATLILRIALGVMFLAHGLVLKFFTFGLEGTAGFFESIGYPAWTAYLVFALETLGGIALILGIGTRMVSAILIPILVGAAWVHVGNGWVFSAEGGGWEYPVYLVVLAVVQVLLGSGPASLDRKLGREAAPVIR
ncbi:MAG: DoxX family protein [Wenzhouxiangellaceae bacterium]|nr:DoxX family protein [Wenzhouxiangellaceae bacterium]